MADHYLNQALYDDAVQDMVRDFGALLGLWGLHITQFSLCRPSFMTWRTSTMKRTSGRRSARRWVGAHGEHSL